MDRKEIVNSKDYNATKVALCWYPTLTDEEREDMDVIDAYADGVIYGWNNPQWIPVKEELPKCNIVDCGLATYPVLVYREDGFIDISCYDSEVGEWDCVGVVTYWMPMPQPPKEE